MEITNTTLLARLLSNGTFTENDIAAITQEVTRVAQLPRSQFIDWCDDGWPTVDQLPCVGGDIHRLEDALALFGWA